jgi:predicted RNA-binding protein Jag
MFLATIKVLKPNLTKFVIELEHSGMLPDNYQQFIVNLLKNLIEPIIHQNLEVFFQKEGDQWRLNLQSKNLQKLVVENKDLIPAIQHILRVIVAKNFPGDRTHFILDVDSLRKYREEYIRKFVYDLAEREVATQGNTVILLHLTSYERRLVHQMLAEVRGLETVSVGSGSGRRLIIRPTSDTGAKNIDQAKVIDIDKQIRDYLDKN